MPVFCLLFRFVLQGLIIKTSFLDIFVCLVGSEGRDGLSFLVGGAEAASLLLGQGVEHFPSHSVVALGDRGAPALWGSKPKCYWFVYYDGSADG